MVIVTKTPEYVGKRVDYIENALTDMCLCNPDLVPDGANYNKIRSMRRELIDLTNGKNTIAFDKLGRPFVAYVFECDNNARVSRYKDLLGSGTETYGKDWENIFPCFVRNNTEVRYLLIQKYRCIRYDGKNFSIGLKGLPQAYGKASHGDFDVSYNGLNSECERVNANHYDGLDIHEVTWDEMGMLMLSSARENCDVHGNSMRGAYALGLGEAGAPCGFIHGNEYVHTTTGSGPSTWHHNFEPTGVADVNGNTRIITTGVRTVGGEIQFIDFRKTSGTLTALELANDGAYQCVTSVASDMPKMFAMETASHPTFMPTGTPHAYVVDFTGDATESYTSTHCINTGFLHRASTGIRSKTDARTVALKEGVDDNVLLRYAGFLPYEKNALSGSQTLANAEGTTEYIAVGSDWDSTVNQGFNSKMGIGLDEASDKLGGLLASYADFLEY